VNLFDELNQWLTEHRISVKVTPELAKALKKNGSFDHLTYSKQKNRFEIQGGKRWVAEVEHDEVTFTCFQNASHCSRPVPIPYISEDDIFHEWIMV
jgi:hypothetical protein